nr:MAG: hypothetical protein [Seabass toti-like virus]
MCVILTLDCILVLSPCRCQRFVVIGEDEDDEVRVDGGVCPFEMLGLVDGNLNEFSILKAVHQGWLDGVVNVRRGTTAEYDEEGFTTARVHGKFFTRRFGS